MSSLFGEPIDVSFERRIEELKKEYKKLYKQWQDAATELDKLKRSKQFEIGYKFKNGCNDAIIIGIVKDSRNEYIYVCEDLNGKFTFTRNNMMSTVKE